MKETYKVLIDVDGASMSWIVWACDGKEALEKAQKELSEEMPDFTIKIKLCAMVRGNRRPWTKQKKKF